MSKDSMKEKSIGLLNKYWVYLLWVVSWFVLSKQNFLDIKCDKRVIIASIAAIYLVMFTKYLMKRKEDDWDGMFQFILLGSFLLRLIFVMFHPYNFSAHDLGDMIKDTDYMYREGHIGYIQYLYQNGHLPDFDPSTLWSFYNPPFYYIIAGLFMKINHVFGLDMHTSLENIQMLTLLFATITIQIGYRILKEFQLDKRVLTFAFLLLAFHPYFIIGGATINNDILSILFIFLAVLYVIEWYKNPGYKKIIKLAFAIGLGMMTKISAGLVAPAVAFLFLVKFIKEKKYLTYIKQFVVFGLICIPLGMYWPVRNLILYDMPLLYVQQIDINSPQYLNHTFFTRVNPFDCLNYKFPTIQFKTDVDYNIWTVMFKTSTFDEMWVVKESTYEVFLCGILLVINMFMGIIGVITGIYNDLKNKVKDDWINWFKILFYVLLVVSYCKFCFNYPLICSMNFRYIVPTILIGVINIGEFMKYGKSKLAVGLLEYGCIAFSIMSTFVYMFIM